MDFRMKRNDLHLKPNQNNLATPQTNPTEASNQIVIMSQPNPVQQRQSSKAFPSLIGQPLIPIDLSTTITSYTQMNKDIINEIKSKHNPQLTINDLYKASKDKCELHTAKLSDKCRKCKQILSALQPQQAPREPEAIHPQASTPHDSSFSTGRQSITGNLNPLILNNILSCQYFKEVLIHKRFQEVIEEIAVNVNNIEAWAVGISGVPSTFFCCLYRLVLLTLDEKQVASLTKARNPYVKAVGLLYIRYLSNPNELWRLLSPFIDDSTLFHPTVDQKSKITIGELVVNLFKDYNHYGTRLPRIPTQIEREIKIRLLMKEEYDSRQKVNEEAIKSALKGWKCVVYKESGFEKGLRKEEVKGEFIAYDERNKKVSVVINGKEVIVGLGDIKIDDKEKEKERYEARLEKKRHSPLRHNHRSRSRSRSQSKREKRNNGHYSHHYRKRGYSKERSRSRDKYRHRSKSNSSPTHHHSKVYKKVIEDEKNAAIARGRDYAIKPTSFKKSISVQVPGVTKKHSRSPSPIKQNVKILQIPTQQKSSVVIEKEEPVYSQKFLERQQQLKRQYQDQDAFSLPQAYPKKGSDYIGPEIMKLG